MSGALCLIRGVMSCSWGALCWGCYILGACTCMSRSAPELKNSLPMSFLEN